MSKGRCLFFVVGAGRGRRLGGGGAGLRERGPPLDLGAKMGLGL